MTVSLIVAIAENNAIGKDNQLLWHLPQDLKRFKAITTGHSIIMGRKTFESIGKPLPNRRSIIISRNRSYKAEGAEIVYSLEEALELIKNEKEVFIIGGGKIYKEALPLADKLYLTIVHETFDADTFFPEINWNEWETKTEEILPINQKNQHSATFMELIRKHTQQMSIEQMQDFCEDTMVSHLGIKFLSITPHELVGKMPVDKRTMQPMGVMHGGASLALIETVGSALSASITDISKKNVFGMSVSCNHIKPALSGYVYAKATFLHQGTRTHVVNVDIRDEKGTLICDGRITNIIIPK